MTVTLAIVGRPNVGKSTLFNRLTGTRHAIVDNQPGVTRDRREGEGRLAEMRFRLIDTAGLEKSKLGSLEDRMRLQTEVAVQQADITLLVIDGILAHKQLLVRVEMAAMPPRQKSQLVITKPLP